MFTVIGGPGVVVETDETKLGKRKSNRGHRIEGTWCVAAIERTSERKVFVLCVDNINSETMLAVLSKYVAPGSIVFTDC